MVVGGLINWWTGLFPGGLVGTLGLVVTSFMVVMLGVFVLRFLVGWADERTSAGEAAMDAGEWMGALLGGLAAALALAFSQSGDAVGMLADVVGQHPFGVANIGVIGLGVGVIEGFLNLSSIQYAGLALVVIGAVVLTMEVEARA